ncbi:Sodium/potassium-transporting ATPase subunit alpha-3 [Candida viswanathii]|uniref:Sodium/potassium-transporting ATPase subunit alpha-3 n=1 Tax=Candida viswanathii TaxID=5486 RepID=A0A367YBJ4_9ASCO|nr:Sodium/potassium-transporting ATPase subunit alpha-3 [Candida viswanathii]
MESTYTESTISKVPEKQSLDQAEETIKFDEVELEEQRGRTKTRRRYSFHSRRSSASRSRIFPIRENIEPGFVLPTVFRTISQNIDNETNSQVEQDGKSKFAGYTFHVDNVGEVADLFRTDLVDGLSSVQYEENRREFGLNKQTKPPLGLLRKIFMYFFGGFGALLLVGGILCIICWKPLGDPPAVANLVLGIILLVVFLIQAGFNFVQDYSSSRVMESIHNLVASEIMCVRQGVKMKVDSADLVPGDIIMFQPGTKIPADARIISNSADLAFDRAILTGESKPIAATSYSDPMGANYLESSCIAMQGTFCINGTGRGVVVSTGDSTIFGTIAKLTSTPSPGFHRSMSFAIATIPESLPVSIAFVLLLTAAKMKQHQILVKSLHMCGTLASCSVLCFDKTGTLTQNNMTVTLSCIGERVHGEGDDEGDCVGCAANHVWTIGTLCNEASLVNGVPIGGNATDRAILQFVENHVGVEPVRQKWVKKLDVPFNSKDKYMISLVEPAVPTRALWKEIGFEYNDNYMMLVKSAPDVLMNNCES